MSCLVLRPLKIVPTLHIQNISLCSSLLSSVTLSMAVISRKSKLSEMGWGDSQTCLETVHFVTFLNLVSDLWLAHLSFRFFVDPMYSWSGCNLHFRIYITFFVVHVRCFRMCHFLLSHGEENIFVFSPCRHVSHLFALQVKYPASSGWSVMLWIFGTIGL